MTPVEDAIAGLCQENWFFHRFTPEELAILAPLFRLVKCPPGEVLVAEKTLTSGFFSIVISGSLEAKKRTELGGSVVLARATRGAILGHSLGHKRARPFPFAIIALEDSEMLWASAEDLAVLLERHPATGVKILTEIIRIQDIRLEELLERFIATL